jgi:uncharacterized protein (TIGR01777 family)
MKVAVAGSSGLIGSGLVPGLRRDGHEVTRLVRRPAGARDEVQWDPYRGDLDPGKLEGVEAFVNLAGAGIGDRKWTLERRKEVLDSRVIPTRLLAETAAKLDPKPKAFLNASGVGFYGYDGGDRVFTESDGRGKGFLADVVAEWEHATEAAEQAGIRTVLLRSGIVQSTAGGALAKQLTFFKLGGGGRMGSGKQYLPWISLADEVAAILFCLTNEKLSGPVNLCAPNPVTNAEFTKTLGRAVHRPTLLPTPTPALKLLFGPDFVAEMLLGGTRARPAKLEKAGFRWLHTDLEAALRDILGD